MPTLAQPMCIRWANVGPTKHCYLGWLRWLHWLQSRFKPSAQITLSLSVQRSYLLTYSYDIVLLYSLGCIHPIPTCQTLITPITLVTDSFLTICTDAVQLPVNGPCKSRYLTKNVICWTVFSWIYSYTTVLLYSLGCIQTLPTCQTLITLITLVTESF